MRRRREISVRSVKVNREKFNDIENLSFRATDAGVKA